MEKMLKAACPGFRGFTMPSVLAPSSLLSPLSLVRYNREEEEGTREEESNGNKADTYRDCFAHAAQCGRLKEEKKGVRICVDASSNM